MSRLNVRRLGYALGAEVTGVDLRGPLDNATVLALRQAWYDNLVICIPGQDLTGEQLATFAGAFGAENSECSIEGNMTISGVDPTNTFVAFLTNKPVNGKPWDGWKEGVIWHSDRSQEVRPVTGTFLLSKEVPDVGGDTMFANQYMAYETLSPQMQSMLEPLWAVHDNSVVPQTGPYQSNPPVVQRVIKTHPETKRKSLYLGRRVRNFLGMTDDESRDLLRYLMEHAVRYEFLYRHRWKPNDLVIWDNRCTMHYAVSDYDLRGDHRHMMRCSVRGPKTGYLLADLGDVTNLTNPEEALAKVAAG